MIKAQSHKTNETLFIFRYAGRLLKMVLALILFLGLGILPSSGNTNVCGNASRTITYDVAAFQTLIPLNGWGDHIPDGLMFALENGDASPNMSQILGNPNLAEPLVMRANVGDCVKVNLRNLIPGRRIGMHVDGVTKDPKNSDGARIGMNPDTTVGTGDVVTYTWYAKREGEFVINDYGSGTNYQLPVGSEIQKDTTSKGLYGALIVEPQGSTWHNPKTGRNLLSKTNQGIGTMPFADIRMPGANNDFRDIALVFMDEAEGIEDANGEEPTFPLPVVPDSTFGFNYRSEPLRNRIRAVLKHRGQKYDPVTRTLVSVSPETVVLPNGTVIEPEDHFCDGYVPELGTVVEDPGAKCIGEEAHLQSWPFGDHGKLTRKRQDGSIIVDTDSLIPKAYTGDPIRFRLVHPGIEETHTFHQHTNRWRHEPKDPKSTRLDVQSTGPGQTFELQYEGGAGQLMKTNGDQVFHCHLYPHFLQGFWGSLRVFDKLRVGTAWESLSNKKYADNTPIETLQELPDRQGATPAPDDDHPGYPLFVKGDYLQKAYRPPYAVTNDPFSAIRRPGDTIRTGNALERKNMALKDDDSANPGVFFVEPCPSGAPERTYNPAAIDAKFTYNKSGWHDNNGKLYVEAPPQAGTTALEAADSVRSAINAGTIQPEPFTFRSRIGECVNVKLTNATHLDNNPSVPYDIHAAPDGDLFHLPEEMAEIGEHVHLVRFDELGSDGTSIGWNYVQAAMNGQTYGYRWFVDLPLRTIYNHDHQYPTTHQQHGLWATMHVEPADATWHDPKTGDETNGVGTVADIHSPSGPDFREISVHFADMVPVLDAAGQPLMPPPTLSFHATDQGIMAVNYRNEPFSGRIHSLSTGAKAEPANIFSSVVHGDPSTPIFKAYEGDPVVIRYMQGAQEEQHNFNLTGHRWLHEPDDPNSNIYDSQAMNIAEFFNFEINGHRVIKRGRGRERMREHSQLPFGSTTVLANGAGKPADYLYSSQPLNDLWVGMWGIFRVMAKKIDDLKPLPDGPSPQKGAPGQEWPALKPGDTLNSSPPVAKNPCPPRSAKRSYAISLVKQKVIYNKEGDNDPNGIAYVLDKDLNGAKQPKQGTALKPLFIRGNQNDCLKITLTNRLSTTAIDIHPGDPLNPYENLIVSNLIDGVEVPVTAAWQAGNRASLHASGLIRYDTAKNDGAAVGYNFDSTIGPNQTIAYNYYLDTKDVGIAGFSNWANIRGTRHHGAWGALIVEPKGSQYLDPVNHKALAEGDSAVIKYPIVQSNGKKIFKYFREFVVDFQDGLNLHDENGNPLEDQTDAGHGGEGGEATDPEDQGEKGINYRSERFQNRLAVNSQISNVFSSVIHGDPSTPVFRAYAGDPTIIRTLNSQDLPRTHTFGLFGHEWKHEVNDPNSNIINGQGGFNTGRAFNLNLIGGSGGEQRLTGDYLYNCRNFFHHLSGGMWGIHRVSSTVSSDLKVLPSRAR